MKRKVYGVGINDAEYKVTFYKPDGKRGVCPFYERWTDMLSRCYSPSQLERMPNYVGTKVCEEWLTFSNFKSWMESQTWVGLVLDKDLLGSGDLYSPSTCVFVPEYVNFALIGSNKKNGVVYHTRDKVYQASISFFGKPTYLGSFMTEEQAYIAYYKAKAEYFKQVLAKYSLDNPDWRVVKRLEVEIENLVRRSS